MLEVRTVGGFRQSSVILGGAQLGLAYGIANTAGAPSVDRVREVLQAAVDAGMTHVDTARGYGDSEANIAEAGTDLTVITKVAPLGPSDSDESVVASVDTSLTTLGIAAATVLYHRAADALRTWDALRGHPGVLRAGVSVQSPEELAAVLELPGLGYVQLPTNVLDRRWDDAGSPGLLAARPGVVVTARSAYLQGLLAAGRDVTWPVVDAAARDEVVRALDGLTADLGLPSRVALCLSFVLALPWVTSVVLGAETADQVRDNAALASLPRLSAADLDAVRDALPEVPAALLDPAQWRTA